MVNVIEPSEITLLEEIGDGASAGKWCFIIKNLFLC